MCGAANKDNNLECYWCGYVNDRMVKDDEYEHISNLFANNLISLEEARRLLMGNTLGYYTSFQNNIDPAYRTVSFDRKIDVKNKTKVVEHTLLDGTTFHTYEDLEDESP
jgi:hypothetical protein